MFKLSKVLLQRNGLDKRRSGAKEKGATLVEYALIIGLVSLVLVVAASGAFTGVFDTVASEVTSTVKNPPAPEQ